MVSASRRANLKEAGLDYYNHNLDTSEEYYARDHHPPRRYQDRLDTLTAIAKPASTFAAAASSAMGESQRDRASWLTTLASLPEHPESVPDQPAGARAGHAARGGARDPFDFIRTIAVARVMNSARPGPAVAGARHERMNCRPWPCSPGEFDFLRRKTADHRNPDVCARSRAAGAARPPAGAARGAPRAVVN